MIGISPVDAYPEGFSYNNTHITNILKFSNILHITHYHRLYHIHQHLREYHRILPDLLVDHRI